MLSYSSVKTFPKGLCGEFKTIIFVFYVKASANS